MSKLGATHAPEATYDRLLTTLEQLLAIEATDLRDALTQVAQLLSEALAADKFDAFLYDPAISTLVSLGVSDTPMGHHQRAAGLDRLPIANRGRTVQVFQTQTGYCTGHADQDPDELVGIVETLGVRSTVAVPLVVGDEVQGVLQAASARPDYFSEHDLRFLQVVARWVGMVAHRAELVERIARDAAEQGRQGAAEELITVMAHDLRNYLTPLRGRIDLIRRRAARENRADYLEDATELTHALTRLGQLVGDLLDVARLEQGIFGITVQPLDLVALAQEAAASFQTPDTEVRVVGPPELVVTADPDRIRQALANLVANAVRHSPPGAPVVVEVGREPGAEAERALVTVADPGPGIPADLLPRLFERFAAGPGSSGLGLGLYLANRIAAAHGGSLTVDTALGKGTRFRLALPLPTRQATP